MMLHDPYGRDDGDAAVHVPAFQIVTGHQMVPMARNVGLLMIVTS